MILVILRDMRWRLAFLIPLSALLYSQEPAFHQHDGFDPTAISLGPLGVSSTLAYFAALSMIILLGGFVSTDRREGYTRLMFSHPTSPLAYYGVRWGLAYLVSFVGAAIFLVVGQLIAWGEFRGGSAGLILPALTGLVYGGIVAFFSVVVRRGDGWIAFLFFLPTLIPQIVTLALSTASTGVRQAILLLLPPLGAFQEIWDNLLFETFAWGPVGFAAAYGAVFLVSAVALLTMLEWP
ncbi:MAG: hypothetical protein WD766_04490 [Gemmatimonadota bacterium]